MSTSSQDLAVVDTQQPLVEYRQPPQDIAPLSTYSLVERHRAVQQVLKSLMVEHVHYGVIPGTSGKPALLKPGAELLCSRFSLSPRFTSTRSDLGNGHREYEFRCLLMDVSSERTYAEGVGSCSTMESKYRWRKGTRSCPKCGAEAIIKGRAEYGGGWLCFQKNSGCGAKFADSDPSITGQNIGRVENPDIYDQYNTVMKMAKKRSLIDAVLTATAASDMFDTSDVEEEDDVPNFTEQQPSHASPQQPSPSAQPREEAPPPVKFVSDNQIKYLMTICGQMGVTEQQLLGHLGQVYKIETRKQIPTAKFEDLLSWVKLQGQKGAGVGGK